MMVSGTRYACVLAVVLALGTTAPVVAATGHSHDGQGGGTVQLSLDHGAKWQTDEALRRGMTAVRAEMAEVLDRMHHGRYGTDEYAALAGRVEAHVDDVVKNCRLPEAADAQLHVVLAEIIDGIEGMRKGPERVNGAARIVRALDAYGTHFDHPGFEPIQR